MRPGVAVLALAIDSGPSPDGHDSFQIGIKLTLWLRLFGEKIRLLQIVQLGRHSMTKQFRPGQ